MRFSLPDEDAREKAAGEALPFRIDRFKEAALAVSAQACLHTSSSGLSLSAPLVYAASTDCYEQAATWDFV